MEKAIIVDLDGTLFNIDHRKKYIDGSMGKKDWDKFYSLCEEDTANEWCVKLCAIQQEKIFITGRPEKCRDKTLNCFYDNFHIGRYQLYYNAKENLYMRKDDDFRKDYIFKKEIYEEHIKGKYDILFAIDDRQQIVDMWREQGLVCLQCDKGDF